MNWAIELRKLSTQLEYLINAHLSPSLLTPSLSLSPPFSASPTPFLSLSPLSPSPHTLGAALGVALNLIWQFDLPSWLLVPLLASAATLVGLLYPYVIGEKYADAPDTSKVMRCVAVSVGIYQATIVSLIQAVDNAPGMVEEDLVSRTTPRTCTNAVHMYI